MHLVSPMYCFFLHLVEDVEFLVSPALMKVYDVLPISMYGQVRHLCLELQQNVPAGVFGDLPVFANFRGTSRSRRLEE